VKPIYRTLAAALVGAAIVVVAMWLSESVVAQGLSVPLEVGSLVILLVLFVASAVLSRRGTVLGSSALLVGAAAAWALRVVNPLSLCQSNDMLYRPCTASEVAWMALPAVGLLIAGSILLTSALSRKRPSR
jgi:uncharacterized membrane protein YiaA